MALLRGREGSATTHVLTKPLDFALAEAVHSGKAGKEYPTCQHSLRDATPKTWVNVQSRGARRHAVEAHERKTLR
eukprot:CAMPEP_0206608742 /NCGR_PEP_ID=MMETSP0325_2-20121206/53261_1 /ASSEMBLY_ACC=CAM_ASM_000347 /TAXON_ID=2866 /ORGANISM="Crypthecodinium cohnii, Strain Seligo" /LENGTH=74 /DNA_ID=CAMNT_0054126673 /DNA_START=197 /DNA_END=418 /DNA_ORIENTATION=-